MLSPAESLGLSGATLEGRVRRAVHQVSDAVLQRIAERLRADALTHEVIYEHDGVPEAVRIMLRPLLAMPEQLSYVHHVCLSIIEALKRMPALYLEDQRIRHIIAITPGEEAWLGTAGRPRISASTRSMAGSTRSAISPPPAGRIPCISWSRTSPASAASTTRPLAEELVMRDVVPTLLAHDPDLAIELPRDQRDLFVQLLIDHAKALGRRLLQPLLRRAEIRP